MAKVSANPQRRQGLDWRRKGPCPSKAQPREKARYKERRPSNSSMPQEVKNEWQNKQQRPDKPLGHGKCMNSRQTLDSHGSGACIRLRHHPLVPSQYRSNEPWVRGKTRYGLAMGRKGSLLWGSCSSSFGGNVQLEMEHGTASTGKWWWLGSWQTNE